MSHAWRAAARERGARWGRHAWQVTQRSVVEFFDDRCLQLAAAISYYALFAVFPVAILAVGLFGLVIGEEQARQDVVDFLVRRLPVTEEGGRQDIAELLRNVVSNSDAFRVVGVIGLIVSASGLMASVRNGLNTAWDVEDRRPPLQGKLIDILLVFGVGLVFVASFAISITRAVVHDVAEEISDLLGVEISTLVASTTWVLPVLLSLAIFTFLYRVIPATQVRWRDALIGGALTTVGYELGKVGFGIYLDNLANYGTVYGSLGAVIAFVFFVFLIANIFLLGAEVASEHPRVAAGVYDREPDDPRGLREQVRDALRSLVVSKDRP